MKVLPNLVVWLAVGFAAALGQLNRPNIVLILTDDVDVELGGDAPLEKAHGWINDNGVDFSSAYVTVPVCCPSRSSLLTGLYQHNHGVANNSVSGECSGPGWRSGPETQSFASYLKGAGYLTFYGGKYLNTYGYEEGGGIEHVPDGWDVWAGLVGNSAYYNYTLSINGEPEEHGDNYEDDYLTDVIGVKANSFLDFYFDQIGPSLPFLMVLSTPAAHDPFTPAPQYANDYSGVTAPRTPSFNYLEEDVGANPKHWFVNQGPRPLGDGIVAEVDEIYRDRLRTMLSVDDMVDNVLTRLDGAGVLENTFVMLTSDHGYHMGQFAMHKDKRQLYEFDTRIPLSVSGPGVRQNVVEPALISLVDLAPTIIEMSGTVPPPGMDGTSFLPWLLNENPRAQESVLISYVGEGDSAEECGDTQLAGLRFCQESFGCKCQDSFNNTYSCVRTLTSSENNIFCQFDDDVDFEEFYDLNLDPYQLLNTAPELEPETRDIYVDRLDNLRTCSGTADCFQEL